MKHCHVQPGTPVTVPAKISNILAKYPLEYFLTMCEDVEGLEIENLYHSSQQAKLKEELCAIQQRAGNYRQNLKHRFNRATNH